MVTLRRDNRNRPGKKSRWQRFILLSLGSLLILSIILGYLVYRTLFMPNTWTGEAGQVSVYIPTGSSFEDVKRELYSKGLIRRRASFEWVARQKKYPELVKPGHYLISRDMSNDELINMLRAGNQVPVMVTFTSARSIEKIAGRVASQIEADSTSIMHLCRDPDFTGKLGFTPETISLIFIPNTYEFWWTTNAEEFLQRIYKEYEAFWEGTRKIKAESLGMTIPEVVTLASIVEKETNKDSEKPTIAGVYINRLNKNWKLQADPTLIYALNDPGIRRVLNIHKNIDSPYNTYKYTGLPPGPICIPGRASIDAVLDHQDHDYMFFCASPEMDGYHVFSRTLRQHNKNARAYQKALDQMKVFN